MAGFSRISVQKRKIDRSVASRNRWLEYQGKTVAQQERSQSVLKDVNYKRNDGKGSSVPRKKDEDAAEGGRKRVECSRKDSYCIAGGKKLGRKVEGLKWKMSESGVSPLKMRPKECWNAKKTVKL